MVINQKKTQIMNINFSKSLDFPPEMTIGNSDYLDLVKNIKLVGIIVSDDLKWNQHVDYMCKRASKKIWLLRRMKTLRLEPEILLDFYCKEVRSIGYHQPLVLILLLEAGWKYMHFPLPHSWRKRICEWKNK